MNALLLFLTALALVEDPRQNVISGESGKPALAWRGEALAILPGKEYIVSGRLRVEEGEAWIAASLLGRDGKTLSRFESSRLAAGNQWVYAAVETADPDASATAAIVEFWVHGKAALESIRISPLSPQIVANGDFEAPPDKKGRVAMWSEEQNPALITGNRAGSFAMVKEDAVQGTQSLRLTSSGDWFGITSVPYTVPAWSDRFALVARARCAGAAEARLAVLWTGDVTDQVLRKDESPLIRGSAWQDLSTGTVTPPPMARSARLDLIVSRPANGSDTAVEARFDAIDFITLSPKRKEVRVLANQLGYGLEGAKTAIILTNFFPATALSGEFAAIALNDAVRFQGNLHSTGRMVGEKSADWGWYFWRADFSSLKDEGRFKIRARVEGVEGVSHPFSVQRDLLFRETTPLLANFFFIQRCGFEVPGWHGPCHLDDARLANGSHRDLAGGWHSAGDYNKITWEYGDGGAVYALAHAAAGVHGDPALRQRLLAEAKWGADYLVKIANPATGAFLKDIQQGPDRQSWMRWVPPEKQTDNQPGTADDPVVLPGEGHSPLAPGGWTMVGRMLKDQGVQNDLAGMAIKFWDAYAKIAAAASNPLDLLSAVDLYRVTGEERFLEFSRKTAGALLSTGNPAGPLTGGYGDSGDIPAAALAVFALQFPAEPLSQKIRDRLRYQLEGLLKGADNPLGIPRHGQGEAAYFFEPSSAYGWNFLFGVRAWTGFLIFRLLKDARALDYGLNQLDFILGKNPYNLCMFEGKGTFNPPRYHHRYDSIPGRERGAVPGAIPNGFVRDIGGFDRPGFDLSTSGRPHPSYRTSEPWLVHNVFFLLAINALHEIESGQPPSLERD